MKNPSFELATENQVKYWVDKSPKPYSLYRDNTAKGYYSFQYKGSGSPKEKIQKVDIAKKHDLPIEFLIKN